MAATGEKQGSTAVAITLALLVAAFMIGMIIVVNNIQLLPETHLGHLAGQPPPAPDDHTISTILAVGGTLVGPFIGVCVALYVDRVGVGVLFAFLLVIGIAFGSLWLPGELSKPTPISNTNRYLPSAEYSGGTNECPGG